MKLNALVKLIEVWSYFLISWLDCEQYGKNQYKKMNTINIVQCLNLETGSLASHEKAHDNKEFSCKNVKYGHESQMTTH